MKTLNKFVHHIFQFLEDKMRIDQPPLVAFGIFNVINFSICYSVWDLLFSRQQNNILLRAIAIVSCLLLIVKNYWPKKLNQYLPIYWFTTIFYCLVFSPLIIFLKNSAVPIWSMNLMLALFLLILLVDWMMFAILIALGVLTTFAMYLMTGGTFSFLMNKLDLSTFSIYMLTIVLGLIFFPARKDFLLKTQVEAAKLVVASIAHELRTPLASIRLGVAGLVTYLPKIIHGYQIACKNNLEVATIREKNISLLESLPERINREILSSNTIIDIMLMNVSEATINRNLFTTCSIDACVDKALERYPFHSEEERTLINWKKNDNFEFLGDELRMIHVLFNLLRNSLYYINAARKGSITMWIEKSDQYNILFFKDTASGIAEDIKENLFAQFRTHREGGSGIGLAFCKNVMKSVKGNISCKSVEGEYTIFTLTFPLRK